MPYDRGAHWIHAADINPVAKLAPQTGLEIYPAPPGQRMRIGRRYAREGEMEDFLAALVRANSAIADAARGKSRRRLRAGAAQGSRRMAADHRIRARALTAAARSSRRSPRWIFAARAERDNGAFCRQGLGALLAKLAPTLPCSSRRR